MAWFKKKAKNENKDLILSEKKSEAEHIESGKERQELSKKRANI